jgi:hypothetical protein
MWLSEGLPWAKSGAEKAFDTVPDEAQFGALAVAYSEWDGRVKA